MHHLIFEGAELSGKSWIISQVYNYLEPKYNQSRFVLDGCHWFNCDVGVYGTKHGKPVIESYLKIFKELKGKNLIVEKLHLSDMVYNRLYHKQEIDYTDLEKDLLNLNFKIILIAFPEDEQLLKKRISDRLSLYPHYKRILHKPEWYIEQQKLYLAAVKRSKLPYLIIKTRQLPDEDLVKQILSWLGEKDRV